MREEATIQLIAAEAMPGGARKRIEVPEGHVALLVEGQKVVGQRGAGAHHLGNWPRPAPDALLLPDVPFDLRLRIRNLRSGDGLDFDLVWPITLQVRDASRFFSGWRAFAAGSDPALVDLEDALAGRLWEAAEVPAAAWALEDLRERDELHLKLSQALRPALAPPLADLGLVLVGSQLAQPRTLEEDRGLLLALSQAARAERDARFEALFERLEDRDMLAHRLAEWSAGRGEPAPDPAVVELLWQVVDKGPEGAAERAQRAAQALDQKVNALERSLEAERSQNERRFHQLMARLGPGDKAAEKGVRSERDEVRWLKQLLFILRIAGAGLTAATAAVALLAPHLVEPHQQLQFWATVTSLVTALLTILSEVVIRLRTRRAERQAEEHRSAAGKAPMDQRRRADRLVRARIEASLKQAIASLQAAWRQGCGPGGAANDLAVQVRGFGQQVEHFQEREVRAANYQASRYLARDQVPDAELGAVMDLDEELLARSQGLAQKAEELSGHVIYGRLAEAQGALQEMRNGLTGLRNRFIERGAYLAGS